MAWLEGSHSETRTIAKPVDTVKAHFGDLETIIANSADVETATVDGDTIHYVLKMQDHGLVQFQGDYKVTYTPTADGLTWQPTGEGNTKQSGSVIFRAVGDGTELEFSETLSINLPIPAVMAPMIKPMVGKMLAGELKGFLDRMSAAL